MREQQMRNPYDRILVRLRKLCLSLPSATETLTWGHPIFRVAGKIFVGYGEQDGHRMFSAKVGKARQRELLRDARYLYADYVGRFGWVAFILEGRIDWNEVAGLVLTSYRLIAPRRLLADLKDAPANRAKRPRVARRSSKPRRRDT